MMHMTDVKWNDKKEAYLMSTNVSINEKEELATTAKAEQTYQAKDGADVLVQALHEQGVEIVLVIQVGRYYQSMMQCIKIQFVIF